MAAIGPAGAGNSRIVPVQTAPDPLLNGPPPGLCNPRLWSPDYTAGTDAYGQPVVRADVTPPPVTIPDDVVVVPQRVGHGRKARDVDVAVAVPGLHDATTPPDACPPPRHR